MEKRKINIMEIGLKAKSKAEMYWLLVCETNIYLPPEKNTTYNFLNELITGKKR